MSLLTDPTSAGERDTVSERARAVVCEQRQQPRARPLAHLAVLLGAPAVDATELGATRLTGKLACEHEPLVAGERVRESSNAAQVLTQECQPLDVRARVGHVYPTACAAKHKRARQGGLDRAAPAERTAAILDAREELLLERVGDVGGTGELLSASDAGQQLERRLAVAILEILVPKSVTVGAEQ